MKRIHVFNLAIAFVTTLASCYREPLDKLRKVNGVNWSGTYAVPLVDARLNMEDVTEFIGNLAGTGTYPDKLLYFEYKNTHFSSVAASAYRIAEANARIDFPLSTGEANALQNGTTTFTREFWIQVSPGGTNALDSIRFASGDLSIKLSNDIPHDARITLSLPDIKPLGTAVITQQWTGSVWTRQAIFNLSGSTCNLSLGPGGSNQLRIRMEANYTRIGGNPVSGFIGPSCNAALVTPQFEWIEGNLDAWNMYVNSDSFKLGIFTNDITRGKLIFNDARFKFRWSHNLSQALPVALNSLAFNMQDGSTEPVSGVSSGLLAPPSADPNIMVGDSLYLKSTNSNVASIVKDAPRLLSWQATVTKPAGRQRLYAGAKAEVHAALELPFSGTVQRFTLSDTADFDLGIGKEELDYIDWINLKLSVDNGIPMAAGVQMLFLDANGKITDSLLQPYRYILPAANVDINGNVVSPHTETYDVRFERQRISHIAGAVRAITRVEFPSAQVAGSPVPVKISSDNRVGVKLGVHSKVTVKERF
jgi:hypothetical protein